jgi:hypothetical protein
MFRFALCRDSDDVWDDDVGFFWSWPRAGNRRLSCTMRLTPGWNDDDGGVSSAERPLGATYQAEVGLVYPYVIPSSP